MRDPDPDAQSDAITNAVRHTYAYRNTADGNARNYSVRDAYIQSILYAYPDTHPNAFSYHSDYATITDPYEHPHADGDAHQHAHTIDIHSHPHYHGCTHHTDCHDGPDHTTKPAPNRRKSG
jgi:hypothetical protein